MLHINFNNLFSGNFIKKTLRALSVVFIAMLIGAIGASQAQAAPDQYSITTFTVAGQVGPSTIDVVNETVAITVPAGTDLTDRITTFTVGGFGLATTNDVGGFGGYLISTTSAVNFTHPVDLYAVSTDEQSARIWRITASAVIVT